MSEERDFVHQYFGGEARPGDIAPYVLVPGTKDRVRKFAAQWDEARQVADHYEWLVYTGVYRGVPISACSTGIGGTSVSTAVEELARLGARTFLRAGVTRPLVDELDLGEAVIARGAVRLDGASHDYVRPEYPAVADIDVLTAAAVAAEHLDLPYKIGVIGDMASLGSRSMEGHRRFLTQRTEPIIRELYEAGVIDGTGESAVLMIQCALYGLRCGVINVNGLDQANDRWVPIADDRAVALGLETIRVLAAWDKTNGAGHAL